MHQRNLPRLVARDKAPAAGSGDAFALEVEGPLLTRDLPGVGDTGIDLTVQHSIARSNLDGVTYVHVIHWIQMVSTDMGSVLHVPFLHSSDLFDVLGCAWWIQPVTKI